jgi:DNA-binding response OmpR family regulator
MSRKILLIDDEDDIREVATMTLETMAGFEVITAPNGIAGIAKAESERPDAILLDVMMPGIDGMTTFQRLQESETTRSIPVIFMTAKVQAADRKRLADLGARGVIAKPFDPMTLSDEVLALLK